MNAKRPADLKSYKVLVNDSVFPAIDFTPKPHYHSAQSRESTNAEKMNRLVGC